MKRTRFPAALVALAALPGLALTAVSGPALAGRGHGTPAVRPSSVPPAQSPDDAINGVVCHGSGCIAVGTSGPQMLAENWFINRWTVHQVPLASGSDGLLSSVACTPTTAVDCLAVGEYFTPSHTYAPLIEQWNGTSWRELPSLGVQGALYSVSCSSKVNCMAAGVADIGGVGGTTQALSALWNGSTWRLLATPSPGGIASGFYGVSCLGVTDCHAVGGGVTSSGQSIALDELWNGSTWQIDSVPVAASVTDPVLTGVSCVPSTPVLCYAVGHSGQGASGPAIADEWENGAWTPTPVPSPPSYQSDRLNEISCWAATDCMAVGYYTTSTAGGGQVQTAQAYEENGSAWRPTVIANPGGSNRLMDVSCPSLTCMAAGSYLLGQSQHELSLAETWNDAPWKVTQAPPGYQILLRNGGVYPFNASWYGSQHGTLTGTPAVSTAADPQTGGYWILDANGDVAGYNTPWYGSDLGHLPGTTAVAIAADPVTGGYWILKANGGVDAFNAPWYGSERGHLVSRPTGIVADPVTGGYWILNADGGVDNYHAPWYGSERGHVTGTALGISADPATGGYWILDSEGGIGAFHAPWYGSERGRLTATPVGIVTDPGPDGYWILNARGGISGFHAPWYGSLAGSRLAQPPASLTGQG